MMPVRRLNFAVAAALSLLLAACGGGGDDGASVPERGALYKSPPAQLAALTAESFTASLQASASGAQLLQVAGTPTCGFDVHYIQYGTVGALDESASATGAMFVPTGTEPACTGPRPVLLYAHGTTVSKDYNLALLGSTNVAAGEAVLVAAMYAAQGYIVVAPNYAGFEASTLSYHAFLNADQQSKDMIDALKAGRSALPAIGNGTTDDGKLFITGYSLGGFVAMATHRALQEAGETVTASVGQSGPYATSTLVDGLFGGTPYLGGTVFATLAATSWQNAYGDIYTVPSDFYTSTYATGIDTLLPSTLPAADLFSSGKLPQLAVLGNDVANYATVTPQFQIFYGPPDQALINTTYANSVLGDLVANPCPYADSAAPLDCQPASPVRRAGKANDLRTWTPASPLLMCGGNADPTVSFVSSTQTQAYFQAQLQGPALALTTLVDVDSAPAAGDPFAPAKAGFAQAKAATGAAAAQAVAAAGGDAAAQAAASASAIFQAYHGSLVAPFCNAVARGFFSQF